MLLQRLDDYQTWLLTHGSTALLVDPTTPVYGTPKAAKAARKIGMTSTHAHKPGDTFVIEPVVGGTRVYFDPHLPSSTLATSVGHADVLVAPVRGMRAVIISATAGPKRVVGSARAVGASVIVPTALDPKRDMNWWQRIAYRGWGSVTALQKCASSSVLVLPENQVLIDLDDLITAN